MGLEILEKIAQGQPYIEPADPVRARLAGPLARLKDVLLGHLQVQSVLDINQTYWRFGNDLTNAASEYPGYVQAAHSLQGHMKPGWKLDGMMPSGNPYNEDNLRCSVVLLYKNGKPPTVSEFDNKWLDMNGVFKDDQFDMISLQAPPSHRIAPWVLTTQELVSPIPTAEYLRRTAIASVVRSRRRVIPDQIYPFTADRIVLTPLFYFKAVPSKDTPAGVKYVIVGEDPTRLLAYFDLRHTEDAISELQADLQNTQRDICQRTTEELAKLWRRFGELKSDLFWSDSKQTARINEAYSALAKHITVQSPTQAIARPVTPMLSAANHRNLGEISQFLNRPITVRQKS